MARIIVNSRYIKNTSKTKGEKEKLVEYIGTREGVEKILTGNENNNLTEKQSELMNKLEKEIPNVKEFLEYDDFKNSPTIGTANKLIERVLEEENFDLKKYVSYIAERPNVEKIEEHGLFTESGVGENLKERAKEVAEHEGNVWTHVISLKREDAETLGFNNYNEWKNLIDSKLLEIAKAHSIKINNLKYISAFHNESYHPHVHLAVYSKKINEGYIRKDDIKNLKRSFANEIFKDEMLYNFKNQNEIRDELRKISKESVNEVLKNIKEKEYENKKVFELIKNLKVGLGEHKGSKSYAWISKGGSKYLKNYVDEIAKELSKDEDIKELFNMWCDAKENNLKIYNKEIPKRKQLYEYEEFKPFLNYIIKEVDLLEEEEELKKSNNLGKDLSEKVVNDINSRTEKTGVATGSRLLKSLSFLLRENIDIENIKNEKLRMKKNKKSKKSKEQKSNLSYKL